MMIRNGEPPQKEFITGVRPERPELPPPAQKTETIDHNSYDVFEAAQLEYNFAASAVRNFIDRAGPKWADVGAPELDTPEVLPWNEYSPYSPENAPDIEGYPDDLFIKSRSPMETARLKREFDKGVEREQILNTSDSYGTLSMVGAGLFNPVALVPLYGFAGQSSRATMNLMKGAAYTGGAEAFNEYILHKFDAGREAEQSAMHIVGATVFGGILGGVLGRGSKHAAEYMAAEEKFLKEDGQIHALRPAQNPDRVVERGESGKFESRVKKLAERDEVGQITGTISRIAAHLTPIRTLASNNPLTRQLAALMGEQTVVGTNRAAIETVLTRMEGELAQAIRVSRTEYAQTSGMKYAEFQEEIAHALRNGDVHDIPEVQKAAKHYRKILESMKKDAVKYGMLKDGDSLTKFADTYFPRVYNIGKMKADSMGFRNDISEYIQATNAKITAEEADAVAKEILRDITSTHQQVSFHKAYVPKAGPMKGRTLAIPDNVLQPWLINEPEAVMRQYTRNIGARTQLYKRFGDDSLEDQFKEVEDKWVDIIQEAKDSGASTRKLRQLTRARERDVNDLRAMRDRLLSRYGLAEDPGNGFIRAGRVTRNLNALRLLGGMTLSAFPDLARPIWKHGLTPYVEGTMKLLSSPSLRKMAKADVQRMGTALDLVLDQRLRAIAELDYNPYGASSFERGLEALTQGTGHAGRLANGEGIPDMGRMSLMSYWNASLKMLSGVLSQDGLIRKIMMPNKHAGDLTRAGIDPNMSRRILEQYKKHGTQQDGLRFGNSDQWTDIDAAEAFETAIIKEVDSTIVTPGIMDRPKWMSTETGKVIGQLKSFAFASTNRQFLAGMAQADGRILQGIVASTVMGSMSLYLKGIVAGKTAEEITGDDPMEFMWESMVHSGAIGIGSELSDIAQSATGENRNQYGFTQTLTGKVLGPTAGFARDAAGAGFGDVEAMRRMIPYNNLFYMRRIIDKAVEQEEE